MNTNDARVTRVYTQETGGPVVAHINNPAPNATQPASAPTFDVVIEVEAGNTVANSNSPYFLYLVTVDETEGVTLPAPFTSTVPSPPATPNFSIGAPWTAVGSFPFDYELLAVVTLPRAAIPIALQPLPHILKCYAALVSAGNQFVSVVESEPFVIV